MKLPVALVLSALSIVSEPSAQTVFETQLDISVESCVEAVANAESSNAFGLLLGAESCYREGLEQDGTFLRFAGRQRSLADMAMFDASDEKAERAKAELRDFAVATHGAENMGSAELYRDANALQRLIARLRDWQPDLPEAYDPGWAHRENPNTALYDVIVDETTETSVAQIEQRASLLANDEYYAATTELAEIQRRHPSVEVDSDDYVTAQQLTARMTEIRSGLAAEPPPYEYRPDPNAAFRQVFMGVNGRSRSGSSVFSSRNEVLESWLARTLSNEQLDSVLEQIDFDEQALVSFNVGEAYTATGRVYITHLKLDPDMAVRSLYARVGLNEPNCEYARGSSYPFALAIVDRASVTASGSFLFASETFDDGCQRPASASPND